MNKQNQSNKSEQNISDIRINKKMRLWNKYKNYIIAVAGIIAVIFLVVVVFKGCGKSGSDESAKVTDPNEIVETTKDSSDQSTQSASEQTKAVTQSTTQAATGNKIYTTTRVLAKEDFTSSSFYENSVFLGDFIVSGIEYYGFLGKNKVVADTNLTTDKALNNIDQLASSAPQKVFIMLGINDLNYGVRSVDTIAANYATLIAQIKGKLPSAKIYILSVLPITQSYETKANVYIRKTNLDQLNGKLKEIVTTSGVDYLELGTPFSSSTGYLNESATSNGLNISSDYYGFLLNTIADMLK